MLVYFGSGWSIFLTPDGLTVILARPGPLCYSWNHDTVQLDPVHFDNQVHISWKPSPDYSPDGKFLVCWSDDDSQVRVWDMQTHQLVSEFSTSEVGRTALLPALIDHSPGDRLIG